jgi:hypothetical protein
VTAVVGVAVLAVLLRLVFHAAVMRHHARADLVPG